MTERTVAPRSPLTGPVSVQSQDRLLALRRRLRRILQHQLLVAGSAMLVVLVVVALFPATFATHGPFNIIAGNKHFPPSAAHFFGTDELGRDIYSRVVYGLRLSLSAGFFVVLGAVTLGTLLGIYAGYRGGTTDNLIMRASDVFLAFPGLVMAMAFVAALGPGLRNAMLALTIIWWPQYARLARGQVLMVKNVPYVEAAQATGAGDVRILVRHILPNIFAPIFIKATLDLGHAILVTATLSFLGLGARPPDPELGAMVTAGRTHLLTSWWYSTFPGLAIFMAVLAINLIGDGLRDLLDPALRKA
jgi:peptide/nickel transport system permease protein